MKFSRSSALVGACLAAASAQQVTCKSGVHVIVARESLSPPGYGLLQPVAANITQRIPDSDSIAVPYPASIFDPPLVYTESEPQGVGNMTKLIKEYGDACPDGKMVIMGYSQGAHVSGDVLIGSKYSGNLFPPRGPIDEKYRNNVVAVVLMGDPAYVVNQPFNVGTAKKNGTFPRQNVNQWSALGLEDKVVAYCDENDQFCSSGTSLAVHVGYIGEYGEKAIQFVVDKASGKGGSGGSGGGNSSAPPQVSSAAASVSSALSSAMVSASASGGVVVPTGSSAAGGASSGASETGGSSYPSSAAGGSGGEGSATPTATGGSSGSYPTGSSSGGDSTGGSEASGSGSDLPPSPSIQPNGAANVSPELRSAMSAVAGLALVFGLML